MDYRSELTVQHIHISLYIGAVTCALTSNATCATGNPATSNTINMTVNPLLPVSVSIIADNNPVCAGTTVNYTATPTNGGTSPSYQWKVNGLPVGTNSATYSYIPLNTDAVTCALTSNATCATGNPATSNTINMTVNPLLPVSVSIGASANPVCAGTTVTFTATPTNGGASPSYQWKVNGINVGTNSATYSYIPLITDAVTCALTSNATCATGNPATSNTINMTVNPLLPVSVSIIADNNPVCAGTTVNYTATPTNGGTSPSYQWKVNGLPVGTNSATYSYIPLNNDTITCVMTSNCSCPTGNPSTSNMITMMVNPDLPVSVSIGSSANPVCSGTSVTFIATPTNGGSAPFYQWLVNGLPVGTNSTTYSYIPVNNDVVTCVLFSNATCATSNPATSNPVTMTVSTILPVSVSISATANPVCAATSVTFTATPTNGGTAPIFQWKVNGINVGLNSPTYSYVPVNNDAVTCELTSNVTCATGNPAMSNTITMIVNPNLPVSISIDASANPVCAGTSVLFTATPTNGGASPSYQWKVNGLPIGINSSTYSYIPVNNDAVSCVLTSNATCTSGNPATSNTVTMTVNPNLPVSLSIGASANPVCAGASVTFTATPSNGGTTPTYQWKVNGTNVGNNPLYTYAPATGDNVTCVLNSNATCTTGNPATSNQVIMTVNPLPSPTVSGSGLACNSSVNNIYTTQPGMVGYSWTVTGGTINIREWNFFYCCDLERGRISDYKCKLYRQQRMYAASPGSMTVIVIPLPTPTILGPISICAGSTANIYTTQSGMSNYTWSISAGGTITGGAGTNSVTITWNTAGAQTISVNYNNAFGCSASSPTVYNVTVNPLPSPTVTGPASTCLNSTGNLYFTEGGMSIYSWCC